jgi:hypothetical protein
MESRRPSDVLSNDLWSEIGASLKEQNERLRIQNDLLKQLLLDVNKATGSVTNHGNLPNDDKRNQCIQDEPQLHGRNKPQPSLKSCLKRDDSDFEFQGQGQTLLYAADETLKYPRVYFFVDERHAPRLHRLSTGWRADTSWKYCEYRESIIFAFESIDLTYVREACCPRRDIPSGAVSVLSWCRIH